jgi:hypothetical protein
LQSRARVHRLIRPCLKVLCPLGLVVAASACGGKLEPKGIGGRERMLSATAVAKKCEEAAKGHDRPFVVEWDATDLASFEAKAARDTVVVRYEGCELEILHQCSDAVAAGKLGAYGAPQFTSGTSQGFEIENEGELYAKLPLGAAKLAGRVSAGEALSLSYYVTGVATSSRAELYADELAAYPGCEGATHFVWAYNLGAFELSTKERRAAELEVGVGNAGAGAKGSTKRAQLSQGGKLAACEEQDQRGCRVPIRLSLRDIAVGNHPVVATTATMTAGDAKAATTTQADQAEELWKHARGLFERGDGTGCVKAMDKALAADLRLLDRTEFRRDRATCMMSAGQCDEGKKEYRAALATADTKRELEDWQLDRDTRDLSNKVCPAATATDHADFLLRARREIVAAERAKDGKRCEALIKGVVERSKALQKEGDRDRPDFDIRGQAHSAAGNSYDPAALCVAKATKRCKEGLRVLAMQCETVQNNDFCKQAVVTNWQGTVERMKLDCK